MNFTKMADLLESQRVAQGSLEEHQRRAAREATVLIAHGRVWVPLSRVEVEDLTTMDLIDAVDRRGELPCPLERAIARGFMRGCESAIQEWSDE